MNPKINLILTAITVASISGAGYTFKRHSGLKQQLIENNLQCDQRVVELREKYQSEFDKIQKAIDGRVVMNSQVNVTPTSINTQAKQEPIVENTKPVLEKFDESLEEIVRRKYRFLFAKLNLSAADMAYLRQLLLEREDLALKIQDAKEFGDESGVSQADIWELEIALEDVNTRIEDLLDDENNQRYAMLKDSDEEQKQFNQYTLGINGLFPLNNQQQESVLFTRLKHKQLFEETLKNSGLDQDYPLTKEQSDELYKKLEMAAMRYKHTFLQEIRGELDHDNFPMDQYTMLENYTNTEFQQLLDNLRKKIEERGVLN